MSDPALPEPRRKQLVQDLMRARRAIAIAREQGDADEEAQAREIVHETKLALGERGAAWWSDGKPDLNRHMARNTEYAAWYRTLCDNQANRASVALPPPG